MKKRNVILLLSILTLSMTACGQTKSTSTENQWQASESSGVNISNENALKFVFENGMPIYIDSDTNWFLSDIFTVNGSKAVITKNDKNQFDMSFKVKDIDKNDVYINGTVYNYAMEYEESAILDRNGCWTLVQDDATSYKAIYDDGSVTFSVLGHDGIRSCEMSQVFEELQTLLYPENDITSVFEYDKLVSTETKGKMKLESKFVETLSVDEFKKQSGLSFEPLAMNHSEENEEYQIISDEKDNSIYQAYENGTSLALHLNTDSDYISSIFVCPYDYSLDLLNIDSKKIEDMTLKTLYETIGMPEYQSISGVYEEYTVHCTWDNVTFFFNNEGENIGYTIALTQNVKADDTASTN